MPVENFEGAVSALDISLFDHIRSQTSPDDKRALLAVQDFVRSRRERYAYLEIGSYLGGSLQTYIKDKKCRRIYSIDQRSAVVADNRFPKGLAYEGQVKSQQMLDNLRMLVSDLGHLMVFDAQSSQVPTEKITLKPDLCFIDGEHTDHAVEADFNFCRSVMEKSGIVVFHDAFLVRDGINRIMRRLWMTGVRFKGYHLKSSVFVLVFADAKAWEQHLHKTGVERHLSVADKIKWLLPLWVRRLWKK